MKETAHDTQARSKRKQVKIEEKHWQKKPMQPQAMYQLKLHSNPELVKSEFHFEL